MNIIPHDDFDPKNNSITITTNKIPDTTAAYIPSHVIQPDTTSIEVTNKLEDEIDQLKETINKKLNITMLHGCRNCGAKIDCDIDKPVFHCKYCGTTYVIGNVQINSTY